MIRFGLALLLALSLLTFPSLCYDADSILREERDALQAALPDEVSSLVSFSIPEDAQELYTPAALWNLLWDKLRFSLLSKDEILPLFAAVLFCAAASILSQNKDTVRFLCTLCLALCFFSLSEEAWHVLEQALMGLHILVSAVLPVMTALCAATGNVTQSAVTSTSTVLLLNVLDQLTAYVLFPFLRTLFALSVIGRLSTQANTGLIHISKTIRTVFSVLSSAFFLVFSFSLSCQKTMASASDGLLLRSFKFAAGSFVSLGGGALSEVGGQFLSSLRVLRAGAGTAVCLAVVLSVLTPLCRLLAVRFAFFLLQILCDLLQLPDGAALAGDIGSVLSFGTALLPLTGVLLIFSLSVASGGAALSLSM